MLTKTKNLILISLAITFLFFYFFKTVQAEEKSLKDIIRQVISNNPALASARQSTAAAQKRITQTSGLDEPRIAYKGGSFTEIDLIQPFKNPGMQWTEVEASKQEAFIASLNYLTAEREIVLQTKQIYYQIYETDQALQIAERERIIMEAMYQSALRRYETGQVTQQDPLRGNLALLELKTKVLELNQQRGSLIAQLKQLAGGQSIELSTINEIVIPELRQNSIAGNLEVLIARNEYQKAVLEKTGSQVINQPEFELGVGYAPLMGETMGMAGVSLPLWWNKNSARLDAQDSLAAAASKNYENIVLEKQFQTEDLNLKIKKNQTILNLYKTAYLPQTREAFTVAETSYLSGKLDFMDWLAVETRNLDAQLKYYELIAAQAMLFAELEKIQGEENVYE